MNELLRRYSFDLKRSKLVSCETYFIYRHSGSVSSFGVVIQPSVSHVRRAATARSNHLIDFTNYVMCLKTRFYHYLAPSDHQIGIRSVL